MVSVPLHNKYSLRSSKHPRYSSNEFGTFRTQSNFLFTPIPPTTTPRFPAKKSASSPVLHRSTAHSHTYRRPDHSTTTSTASPSSPCWNHMELDSEEEERDDGAIYTLCHTKRDGGRSYSSSSSLRSRREKIIKSISTTPGHLGAGETETEADEPVSINSLR
jgi:hypothetical protein